MKEIHLFVLDPRQGCSNTTASSIRLELLNLEKQCLDSVRKFTSIIDVTDLIFLDRGVNQEIKMLFPVSDCPQVLTLFTLWTFLSSLYTLHHSSCHIHISRLHHRSEGPPFSSSSTRGHALLLKLKRRLILLATPAMPSFHDCHQIPPLPPPSSSAPNRAGRTVLLRNPRPSARLLVIVGPRLSSRDLARRIALLKSSRGSSRAL